MSGHTPGCHHGEPISSTVAVWVPCPLCDAAEDLLAALKDAHDCMERTGIHDGNTGCNSDHTLYEVPPTRVVHHFDCAIQLRMEAAIAKAEEEGGA